MNKAAVISSLERSIRRRLNKHLRELGFSKAKSFFEPPKMDSKDAIRTLHSAQRAERLSLHAGFVQSAWPKLRQFFANGDEIEVPSIKPRLELISSESWQSDLFRLAGLTWAVPVSQGYGRRLRFLVWDDHNGKLIGIMGLCDPVFNLRVRDRLIGWSAQDRKDRLVHVLEANVLGAVPPYNKLLCGKLIACLARTITVVDSFDQRYFRSRGVISRKLKHPSLVLITTASALGRSSVYNRLTLDGRNYFKSIGYTTGWGHFQIPSRIFVLMREYLRLKGDLYASNHKFGQGPNWRLRATRQALELLGYKHTLLRHGVSRELFTCEMADNATDILRGSFAKPDYGSVKSVDYVGRRAMDRWVKPRAERDSAFRTHGASDVFQCLFRG